MGELLKLSPELICACVALLSQPDCTALSAVCKHIHSIVDTERYRSLELTNKSPSQLHNLVTALSKPGNAKKISRLHISYTATDILFLDASFFSFADSGTALQLVPIGSDAAMCLWRNTLFSEICPIAFVAYIIVTAAPHLTSLRITRPDDPIWTRFVDLVEPCLPSHLWTKLQELELSINSDLYPPRKLISLLGQVDIYTKIRKLVLRGSLEAMSLTIRLLAKGALPKLKALHLADEVWNRNTPYAQIPGLLADQCPSLEELTLDFQFQAQENKPKPWTASETITTLYSCKSLSIHRYLLFERIRHQAPFSHLVSLLPPNLTTLRVTGFSKEEMITLFRDQARRRELLSSLRDFATLTSCQFVVDYDIRSEQHISLEVRNQPNRARYLQRDSSATPLHFEILARRTRQFGLPETSIM